MSNVIKNAKIKVKIWSIVGISIISLITLGVISLIFMFNINQGSTDISENWLPSVICAQELNRLTSDYRIQEYKHVLSTEQTEMEQIKKEMDSIQSEIISYFEEYTPLITDSTDQTMMENAEQKWNKYLELSENMILISEQNKTQEAMEMLSGESVLLFDEASQLFLDLVEFNKVGAEDANEDGNQLFNTAFFLVFLSILVIVGVVVLLSIIIASSITRPVKEIDEVAKKIANEQLDNLIQYQSKDELGNLAMNFNKTVTRLKSYINYINEISMVLKQIAEGNLKFQLTYDYTGEFSKIKEALNLISDSLNNTMMQINNSSELVASSSSQMAEGAQALAEGATEQAGTVQQLVATIQDVSEQIKKNAEDAKKANNLVDVTKKDIESSNQQMTHMKQAMEEINEKSRQIVNIIASIEDIASQTNLLAINAAIEAARAGDAGKGFAVVAEQVKVLAEQSAEAAQNTVLLIEGSIQAVDHGTEIANVTAESLISVVSSVEQAASTMEEISHASIEQAEYMSQVEEGVETIANVIQNNSATAEESSATSQELSSQAQILRDLVGRFELKQ